MVIETGGDESHMSFWDDHSCTPLELSCTPTLPRYVSTSKEKERPSSSRTECCNSLHTLNIPMSQRRRTIGGIKIEPRTRSHSRWN
jgi:hypothetical protein